MPRKLYAALIAVVVLCAVIALNTSRFSINDSKSQTKTGSAGVESTVMTGSGPLLSGRTLLLGTATPADLATAFVFASVAIFPNSDLIYVLRADARSDQADLIDSSGRWIASADYRPPDFSGDRSIGLFPACRKQLCGYIGNDGMWVIEPRFHHARPFVNGIAAVYTDDKTINYIDAKGNFVESNPPGSSAALAIADDWFIDQGTSTWHIRDNQGVWNQARYSYDSVASFSKELVIARKSDRIMLVDRFGKVISPAYEFIGEAKDGRAVAALKGKWGVINAKGEWMIEPNYDFLAMNPDGAFQAVRDGHFVLMTSGGEVMPSDSAYFAISMPNEPVEKLV